MPIKFVPQFQSEDGKLHDSLEKAVSHTRRVAIQHMLLDNRETLHLSLAEIDKAATVICAVQSNVAEIFEKDHKRELDISAAKTAGLAPYKVEMRPNSLSPEDTAALEKAFTTTARPVEPGKGNGPLTDYAKAKDSLGGELTRGDWVRLNTNASRDDINLWGPEQYRQIAAIVGPGLAEVAGAGAWATDGLVKRASTPMFKGVPSLGETGGFVG